MNISKENFLALIDTFGDCLWLEKAPNVYFSDAIDKKLNFGENRLEFLKKNLDRPFTVYEESDGTQIVETLFEFILTQVWSISITDNIDLGINKKVYGIKLPKKEIDLEWVWNKVNKAQTSRDNKVIFNLGERLISKLNLDNSCYSTTFGLSVNYLYNTNAEKTIKKITSFLDENDVVYKEQYSWGHWVVNIKISQGRTNIEKLQRALD